MKNEITVNTINGKITASMNTLNSIAIAFLDAAQHYKDEGAYSIAKRYDRVSEEIYSALKNNGYYKI